MANQFKLTIEPEWPNSEYCARYSLAPLGGEPNQSLLASVLVPRSVNGRVSPTTRLVLRHMIWRLHNGAVRKSRKDDPAFGEYRYTWDPLEKLAMEMGLSIHQAKRELETLTKRGIIYRVRRGTTEANSYRLTDPAFMLMHLLQWPVLAYRFGNNQCLSKDFETAYRKWFPEWIAAPDTQMMVKNWHMSLSANEGNSDLENTKFAVSIWDESHSNFATSKAGKGYLPLT